MKVRHYKGKKLTRRFFRKKAGSSIKYKNVVKMIVFRDFLENGSNDFDKTLPNGRGNRYEAFAKNRTSKSSSVLEIFIHKVQIFEKTAKVVSKDRSISRERL